MHTCLMALCPGLTHTHTHTHTFNSPFSGTTRVGRYQKGKTNLDFTEARDSEWHWHQLGHMICDNTFFLISLFKMRHVIFSLNEYVMLCYVMHLAPDR